jgi:hypothetical protein
MAQRCMNLDRLSVRRLKPGEQITERGITAKLLADGTLRYSVNVMERTTAKNPGRGKSDACVALADGHFAMVFDEVPEISCCAALRGFAFFVARISRCRPASGIPGSPRSGRARRGQPASRPRGHGPVAIGGD